MRLYILIGLILLGSACAREQQPATPTETFKTYIKAIAAKDTTTMKLLLASETLKMHEQEAKAQNVTLDEIVKRDTMLAQGQKVVEFRNEKIDGDRATLEVKDAGDTWQTIHFVFEEDQWKINKQGFVDQILQDANQSGQQIDSIINQDRQP